MTALEEKLLAQNKALTEELTRLREQVDYLTKKLFGKSSEKSEPDGLMDLFEGEDFFRHQSDLRKKQSQKK